MKERATNEAPNKIYKNRLEFLVFIMKHSPYVKNLSIHYIITGQPYEGVLISSVDIPGFLQWIHEQGSFYDRPDK